MTTGERVRHVREQLVVGQAELARAAGLDYSGLWSIEHGKRNPRPATLRKIAAALTELSGKKVDPSELVGESKEAGDGN